MGQEFGQPSRIRNTTVAAVSDKMEAGTPEGMTWNMAGAG